ncbi:MAG: ABC transporter permease [Bacteroidales bacterium]|nr:ABC transporter permease [Bacteroidales bacterium]
MKIVSLAIGFSVGLVLLAQLFFERSFDACYPDADRLYLVVDCYSRNGEAEENSFYVSGAVPAGMKEEIPGVEDAMRFTYVFSSRVVLTDADGMRVTVELPVIAADSNYFDLLPVRLLGGRNPKEVLSRGMEVMISRSLAQKMGGMAALEKRFSVEGLEGAEFIVGGIYEDMPLNASFRCDVIVSSGLMGEWSLNNWIGNDRYHGVVKLQEGIVPDSLRHAMDAMQARHIDMEELQASGYQSRYELWPLRDRYLINDDLRARHAMLLLLAVMLLVTAVLNYALISLSSIVNRSKEVAVRKSYGAGRGSIVRMAFSETALHTLLALILSVFLIVAAQDWVHELLGVPVATLLLSRSSLVLLLVGLLLMFVTGILPGIFMARISVIYAFKRFSENRKLWKRGLLAFQFAVFAFLLCLMMNVGRQYIMMLHYDPGYEYENLAYYDMTGVEASLRSKLAEELARLPQVEKVSCGYMHFADGASGNNISFKGESRDLFNVADLYYVGDGFIETLGMHIVEGENFAEGGARYSDQIMVSESFVEKMRNFADWSGGAVGKEICISEHGQYGSSCYTICGVYRTVLLGGIGKEDRRPSVLFYSGDPTWYNYLWVRFNPLTGHSLAKADSTLEALLPGREAKFTPYKNDIVRLYQDSARFRNQVLAGGMVCLFITLMGLLGYINDEVTRRRKEIAIRRVNGACERFILRYFLTDVWKISLLSGVVGCAVAYGISFRYLQQFSVRVSLVAWVYLLALVVVCLIGYACVGLRVRFFLRENPVKSLRSE